ncbi:TetR/AcrR family transcriptional regulator [Saccharothrix syringae]|uniref:TetR family transcriptional regulator n=1 Tax=Saccharothrix syringae TaxID=103733 RepID=A0A5Q0H515_SACSY|nr:TetR family transcriptional regulator [Saccharothrix syringae]QFZ20975.1 TetR family transcriptional regulator [Saccharothrix syringae]
MDTSGAGGAVAGRVRRNDPGRRDRIIDACLDVIAQVGVAGASHRRIAAAAGVPLGSMTYHFAGMDELLREAFGRHARGVAGLFERRMGVARDFEGAKGAVVDIITADVAGDRRDLVISYELCALAARDPAFRDITDAWAAASRRALERHFDPLTARMLDALIEGLVLHRALGTAPPDPAAVVAAVERITAPGARVGQAVHAAGRGRDRTP